MCDFIKRIIKKRFFMKPVVDRNDCPKCGARMNTTGVTYTAYPPQHEFKCPKCGERVVKVDYDLTDNENDVVRDIIDENIGDTLEEILDDEN